MTVDTYAASGLQSSTPTTSWVGRLLAHRFVRTAAIAALPWAVLGASGCQNLTASSNFSQSLRQTASTKTAPTERMLLVADTYAKQGQTERAAGLYARIVKTNPTHRRAVAGLFQTNPDAAARLADAGTLAQVRGGVQLADLSQPATPKAVPAPATDLIAAADLPAPNDAPVRDALVAPAAMAAPSIRIAAAPVAASPAAPVAIAPAPLTPGRDTPQPVDITPQPVDITPVSLAAATPTANASQSVVLPTKGLIDDALPKAISAEFETFGDVEPPAAVEPFGERIVDAAPVATPTVDAVPRRQSQTRAQARPVAPSIGQRQPVAVAPRSSELIVDGRTVSDADYFITGPAGDAELGVDLAAAIAPPAAVDATPDAVEATQEVLVAAVEQPATGWEASTSELPQIKPLRTASLLGESAVAAGDSKTDAANGTESSAEPDIRWALADAGPDFSAIDVTGWTAATSGAKARGRKYATVPQLTALTIAEEITTTQLLTAQAACESPSDEVRLAAAEAVLTHRPSDETAWATVDELLGKGESDIGTLSALMLGTLPADCHTRTMPRLLDLLRTATPDVQSAAALALGGLGQTAQPAVPKLRQLAQTDNACGRSARVSLECLGVEL